MELQWVAHLDPHVQRFYVQRRRTIENSKLDAIFLQTLLRWQTHKVPDAPTASEFLTTLNESHPSISFTKELEDNGRLLFPRMEIIRNDSWLATKVYKKPTATGLFPPLAKPSDNLWRRKLWRVSVPNKKFLESEKFPLESSFTATI